MKKILILVSILSLFITSCSSDDSSSSNNAESNIMIDGVRFIPGTNDENFDYVFTSFEAGVLNGQANSRIFGFSNNTDIISDLESLQIDVVYPSTETSVTGSYSSANLTIQDMYAQLSYIKGFTQYYFTSGLIVVTDLGNNKFKIEFDNVTLSNFDDANDTKTLSGYYKGTFALDSN
jgi:hypothetical protein